MKLLLIVREDILQQILKLYTVLHVLWLFYLKTNGQKKPVDFIANFENIFGRGKRPLWEKVFRMKLKV